MLQHLHTFGVWFVDWGYGVVDILLPLSVLGIVHLRTRTKKNDSFVFPILVEVLIAITFFGLWCKSFI